MLLTLPNLSEKLKAFFHKIQELLAQIDPKSLVLRSIFLEKHLFPYKQEELPLFARAIEQSGSSIIITDLAGNIVFVNPTFSTITGYPPEEVLGKNPRFLKSGETPEHIFDGLWKTLANGDVWRGDLTNRRKSGETFYERTTIAPIKNKRGKVTHYIAVKEDISEQKALEKKLAYLASHDPLTGIANRTFFAEELKRAIARSKRTGKKLAVLFLDLDSFKLVNDTLGHNVGDELLRMVGDRLKKTLRASDMVARFGGDEFTILLEDVDSTEDIEVVVRKILEQFNKPFDIYGQSISWVSTTIGISVYPQHGQNGDELIQQADLAMYKAKKAGKNRHAFQDDFFEGIPVAKEDFFAL